MSFALTKRQFVDGSKTVTRRLGWRQLKPGDIFMGVEKCMGLKKGQKQVELGRARVVSVSRQTVRVISWEEVVREGFPDMSPQEFIEMFCRANKCNPKREITRIEFERLP